jgi:hypothetical protein
MKWFRVAKAGATTDGRKIQRDWLVQAAKNYDPGVYGARIWPEHFRGLCVDSPFDALGDVLSLRIEEDGADLYLLAQVSPTDKLRSINSRRQKVYTSIEIDPEFADTREAYLVGLGVTDSPSSLGTDYLSFCAGAGDGNPMKARKSTPTSLFAAAIEHDAGEFVAALAPEDSLLARVRELLSRKPDAKPEAHAADVRAAVERLAAELAALKSAAPAVDPAAVAQLSDDGKSATEALAAITARVESLEAGFAKIDATPAAAPPPPALGGNAGKYTATDC